MRVVEGMIEVGEPIRFDIYNERGRCILSRGLVLYTKDKLKRVLQAKCYTTEYGEDYAEFIENHPASSPSGFIESLVIRLEVAYTNFITDGYNLLDDVKEISRQIIEVMEYDPDMLIGLIHIRSSLNHAIFRTLQNTVLAVLTARKLKWGSNMLQSIANASLTQNLGMYALQMDLAQHEGELSSFHRAQIRNHPKQSSKLLMSIGVRDRSWIQTVSYHHERMDGSGYPYAHFGKDIPHEARLLAVADRYGSMITPREYREPGSTKEIMRYFLDKKQSQYDRQLSGAMISAMGIFPPGTTVRLHCGEIAIVARRSSERLYPRVFAIWGEDDALYPRPLARDTQQAEYQIVATVIHPDVERLNVDLLWGDPEVDRSEQPVLLDRAKSMAVEIDDRDGKVTLF